MPKLIVIKSHEKYVPVNRGLITIDNNNAITTLGSSYNPGYGESFSLGSFKYAHGIIYRHNSLIGILCHKEPEKTLNEDTVYADELIFVFRSSDDNLIDVRKSEFFFKFCEMFPDVGIVHMNNINLFLDISKKTEIINSISKFGKLYKEFKQGGVYKQSQIEFPDIAVEYVDGTSSPISFDSIIAEAEPELVADEDSHLDEDDTLPL